MKEINKIANKAIEIIEFCNNQDCAKCKFGKATNCALNFPHEWMETMIRRLGCETK